MELRLDLHIHSAVSPDGRMGLSEIVERCRAAGLHGAAVCDHDATLTDAPEYPDFLLIPGVEVSTEHGHLLGLFVSRPVETRRFSEAVETIHAQGGLAVLAHPFEHLSSDHPLPQSLLAQLDGVEVWNSRAERKNRRANAMAADLAARHGLRPFAGSDAHVPQEIGNAALTLEVEEATLPAVKAALLAGKARIQGRPSPARYTAMSQWIRQRKLGASPAGYLKWALFAVKCTAQDIIRKGD